MYSLARFLIRTLVQLVAHVSVEGLEKLPKEGGFIVVSNHLGRLDAALVYYILQRQDVLVMVAEKYRKSFIWRWLVKSLNAIFVDRYNADLTAIRICLNHVKKGGILVLAPEGTRSQTHQLLEGRPGASYIAARSGATIVPVALIGSEDSKVFPGLLRLRRAQVVGRVGDSFTLPPISGKDREQRTLQDTTEMMCRIAALLPPDYRGFYAEHPRLKEMINAPQSTTEASWST